MIKKAILGLLVSVVLSTTGASIAYATPSGGIGISATRIVYKEGQPTAVRLFNKSTTSAYLMNVKVSLTQAGEGRSPFMASPAIFRLDPQSENSVRIVGDATALPRDRESVFYFSAIGIPSSNPLARGSDSGYVAGNMVFSAGNVIKLFWRPSGLASSPVEAIKQLQFTRAPGGIKIKNASPYYVSLSSLRVGNVSVKLDGKKAPLMLAPFTDSTWTVSGSGSVNWKGIDDTGGLIEGSGKIQ